MNKQVAQQYERIRAAERDAQTRRIRDAYLRAPELETLSAARGDVMCALGSRQLSPAEAKARLDALSQQESEILRGLGLPEDTLSLHYRCALCRDTGVLPDTGKPCACQLAMRIRAGVGTEINDRETFERFSEEVYPEEAQKRRALNARRICEQYADALPEPALPNLLVTGLAGLGKSYLGNAVAYRAIERGVDTARVTAYKLLQDIFSDIREHTKYAERYETVPLLVLDDLGSEPVIPNVSVEWLFTILNERVIHKKATVIATNLSLSELRERYGDRVMSRMSDRNTTQALLLTGKNLRWS